MLKRSIAPFLAAVFVGMLFLSFNSQASKFVRKGQNQNTAKSKPNCSKVPDADIVKAIKEQFQADPDIASQMSHLNVSVKKREVKLDGWIGDKALISKTVAIAKKTACVKKVINRLKEHGGGSCGPGQKPCGDICIDKRTTCNIDN